MPEATKPKTANHWIPCTNWKDLPVGDWLVKVDKDRKPYHVANVFLNNAGDKMIIAGGRFYFDVGELIGYADFSRYEE